MKKGTTPAMWCLNCVNHIARLECSVLGTIDDKTIRNCDLAGFRDIHTVSSRDSLFLVEPDDVLLGFTFGHKVMRHKSCQ